ncbi:hypothetical protein ACWEKT_03240 [Nocardia takedensis]|uniref:hypothetical protein n=1 Tax=Nocardia takedensis TaxID=259390 RepID=UPI0012F6C1ED|nr:hypothetical protein [Nocardia takedensis]
MESIGTVAELAAIRGTGIASALGVNVGEDVARRILRGGATVCDVVLASFVLGVDSVQAVVDYAEVVTKTASAEEADFRCA